MAKKGTTMDPNDLGQDGSNSAATLLSAIETIQSLEDEKADTQERIKEEYAAVKATGFDVKIVRKIVARMKRDRAEIEEEEALIETYEQALEDAKARRKF